MLSGARALARSILSGAPCRIPSPTRGEGESEGTAGVVEGDVWLPLPMAGGGWGEGSRGWTVLHVTSAPFAVDPASPTLIA